MIAIATGIVGLVAGFYFGAWFVACGFMPVVDRIHEIDRDLDRTTKP